jgi:hypothetical protein
LKRKAGIPHDEAIIRRLRKDPDFASEYLKVALEDEEEPPFSSFPCATSPKLRASAFLTPFFRACYCEELFWAQCAYWMLELVWRSAFVSWA